VHLCQVIGNGQITPARDLNAVHAFPPCVPSHRTAQAYSCRSLPCRCLGLSSATVGDLRGLPFCPWWIDDLAYRISVLNAVRQLG
jgi:hypothetical protein